MANTTLATDQIRDSAITSAKILDGAIINVDVAANADITRTKILGNAVTETAGGTITGTLDIAGGGFIVPVAGSFPSQVEGKVVYRSDLDAAFFSDGTNFVATTQQEVLSLQSSPLTSTEIVSSTTPVEIRRFTINLKRMFPLGVILQAQVFQSTGGSAGTATVELFDVTGSVVLLTLSVSTTTATNITESASAVPTAGVRTYALRVFRTGGSGGGVDANLRAALLRRA